MPDTDRSATCPHGLSPDGCHRCAPLPDPRDREYTDADVLDREASGE